MIEKSPQYEEGLKRVRAEGSKESAERFRMEVLLDNAELARSLTEFIENNPTASQEEFIDFARKSGKVIHPESVEQFVEAMSEMRSRVLRSIDDLRRESQLSDVDLGKELYRWVLPHKPWRNPSENEKGEIIFPDGDVGIDTSYPLAIIFYVPDDKDFGRIDPRKNVGGFYSKTEGYVTKLEGYTNKTVRTFPLIVAHEQDLKGYVVLGDSPVVRHEKGHAENQAFMTALQAAKKKFVWGNFGPADWNARKLEAEHNYGIFKDIKESASYQAVLRFALAKAKDELLAEYKSRHSEFQQLFANRLHALRYPPADEIHRSLFLTLADEK